MEPVRTVIERLRELGEASFTYAPQIVAALLIVALTWVVARIAGRLLRRSLTRSHMRRALIELFQRLLKVAIWIGGLLVESVDDVNRDKPIQIFAQSFGESSIEFEVTWWTGSKPVDIRTSRDKVIAAVKRALVDAGIEIPFPYRTLTFGKDSDLKIRREPPANDG